MATSTTPTTTTTTTTAVSSTWVIVGASRGIGLEFVKQLLALGHQVVAAVRDPATANQLWQIAGSQTRPGSCLIEQCDVAKKESIQAFAARMKVLVDKGMSVDNVVLNAGVLKYPNRATEVTYADFAHHLSTNTIGPILVASSLLPFCTPSRLIFISSDSGSTSQFLSHEDGFAAYSASKAALNQMLRHMAAELERKGNVKTCVLAVHPGEVATDMAEDVKGELGWEVEGIIGVEESVRGVLGVVEGKKGVEDSGRFWRWDGREHPW